MTMGERLRQLRKDNLKMTMEEFGKQIGVGKTAISSIETGVNNLSDQNIKSICKTNWNGRYVSEVWLRTGEGEMFVEKENDVLSALKAEYHLDDLELILVKKFVNLSEPSKRAVVNYIKQIAEEYADIAQKTADAVKQGEEMTTEEAEAAYRKDFNIAEPTTSTVSSSTSGTERSETA